MVTGSFRTLSPDEAYAPHAPPLTLALTSRCNLKCPYCANPTSKRAYGEMDTAMIDRLLGKCEAEGHQVMAVHGIGEPLLRKDPEGILARMAQLGVWAGWISTNGVLPSKTRVQTLVEAGLKGIYLSMDTLDADLYRRTRGGKLAKVIANVNAAAAAFPDLNIVIGLMNHRTQQVDSGALDLFTPCSAKLEIFTTTSTTICGFRRLRRIGVATIRRQASGSPSRTAINGHIISPWPLMEGFRSVASIRRSITRSATSRGNPSATSGWMSGHKTRSVRSFWVSMIVPPYASLACSNLRSEICKISIHFWLRRIAPWKPRSEPPKILATRLAP